MFNAASFKQAFPLFAEPENQQLVYLDNAATTQRPAAVIDAIGDFYRRSNANTHRSSHRLARRATDMVERCRHKAAAFLGAASADEVLFCRGATEGLNLLAYSLCQTLKAGDEIVLSQAEHHANLIPWQMQAQQKGLKLRFIPSVNHRPDLSQLRQCLSPRTKVVSITAGSNALGFGVDIAGVARQLEERDIALVVDGAQLAAHAVIDVQQLGCDFLVCSAHKFYGPTGIGLVYGRQAALAQLPPWQGGGEMIRQVTLSHSDYAQAPHRFEAGTASLAAIAGLEACLDWLATLDRAGLAQHEQALCQALHRQLATLSTIKLLSEPEHNLGIASFVTTGGLAANDLAHWLDQQDIALRVGHHCAQPLIDSLGVGATLRASVAGYNSMEDIERLVAAIASAPSETTQRQQTTSDHWQADDLSALQWQDLAAHNPWQQRYRQLMRWGDSISEKPGLRCSEHRVDGCESPAWLACRIEGNGEDARCYFSVDSESRIVRGLAALMLVLIDGKTAAQIAAIDWQQAFAELGLEQHLSPSRSNGLWALVKRAQQLASKA